MKKCLFLLFLEGRCYYLLPHQTSFCLHVTFTVLFGTMRRPVMGMSAWTRSSLLESEPQGWRWFLGEVVQLPVCLASSLVTLLLLEHVVPQQILLTFLTLVCALLALELVHHPQRLITPTWGRLSKMRMKMWFRDWTSFKGPWFIKCLRLLLWLQCFLPLLPPPTLSQLYFGFPLEVWSLTLSRTADLPLISITCFYFHISLASTYLFFSCWRKWQYQT